MTEKMTWKEAGDLIFRWMAVFAAGSAAFLMVFGVGIFIPLVIVVCVLGLVWFVRGVNVTVWVAGATLLMTGLWGLIVIYKHGHKLIGPFELRADPWAPYTFVAYFVLGGIILWRTWQVQR